MPTTEPPPASIAAPIRLDKWLWHARMYRSRSLAAAAVAEGRMRVNGIVTAKPAHTVRPGDVLTFSLGKRVVVLRVLAPGARRGPAPEARALYDDLSPPPPPRDLSRPEPAPGGRPRGHAPRSLGAPGSGRVD